MNDLASIRLEICNACQYLADRDCILCGCNVDEKTKDPNEECPCRPQKWTTQAKTVMPKPTREAPLVQLGGGGVSSTAPRVERKSTCGSCQPRTR